MERTIEVWSASLAPPLAIASTLAACLSPDEQARAARFVYPRDRDRFVAGRAFLRLLLARHVGAPPGALRFRYGSHGKPALDGAGDGLAFNLAHSDALAVCAIADGGGDVGVDVERVRPVTDLPGLARTAFSPGERSRLESLPDHARLRSFFEAWTRKEAFLKALGSGLGRPLDSFDVAFGPGEAPRILASRTDRADEERYVLHAFEPEPGYVGALAASGHADLVRQCRWEWNERDGGPAPQVVG